MKKAILYINQFFGQIGGEDKADFEPQIREGKVGPALEYAKTLDAQITHTIICGDNYMGSHTQDAVDAVSYTHLHATNIAEWVEFSITGIHKGMETMKPKEN